MTEPTEPTDRPTHASDDDEIDDPGRDPRGLNPPRNLFGGGPDQDSGRGSPDGKAADTGPADKPGDAGDERADNASDRADKGS